MNRIKEMKNKIYIVAFIFVMIICCTKNMKPDLEIAITNSIKEKISKQSLNDLEIASITKFKWNKFYIFTPYFSNADIENILGEKLKFNSSIRFSDDINLLVFLNKGKIINAIDYPRVNGDFSPVYKENGYSPEEAIFKIILDSNWIFIEEQNKVE